MLCTDSLLPGRRGSVRLGAKDISGRPCPSKSGWQNHAFRPHACLPREEANEVFARRDVSHGCRLRKNDSEEERAETEVHPLQRLTRKALGESEGVTGRRAEEDVFPVALLSTGRE
ncbi:hypothetical protein J437_LFUL001356 [Ladona fulva]|uniref:Uncharacterized protein n=1 Tax=Ladona fulva TaxID=123851 RepID=A0A8K0JVK4_LADFU|nr:hypothetical protein J437_LFUL001356 [Ladona fulva]